MNSLEYKRVPRINDDNQRADADTSKDYMQFLNRMSWFAAACFLIWYWQMLTVFEWTVYMYSAWASLIVFIGSFAYIIVSLKASFGWSHPIPPHRRWKNYAPKGVLVMSISSFIFYWFAAFAYYNRLGLISFPGVMVICYGFSGLLSYIY